MADVLLYQTSDPKFADRAIEALGDAGIPCYRLGAGYVDLEPGIRQNLGAGISLYLRHEQDYGKANAIILKLGAVANQRAVLPWWVAWVLYALLAGVSIVAISLLWNRR